MGSNYGTIPDYFPLVDDFPDDEWEDDFEYVAEPFYEWVGEEEYVLSGGYWNEWWIIGGLILLLFILGALASNRPGVQAEANVNGARQQKVEELVGEATAVMAPYSDYTITQGLHGQSYGHLAIDIAAGRGEPINSPINGRVSERYIDEYNNPTLVIENEVYIVTLLHGDYSVAVGDVIEIGQQIGLESNRGYTKDMLGNLCYERDYCGNHTHFNIYDKRVQANVNPLDLISQTSLLSN